MNNERSTLKTKIGIWIATLMTALVGVINLISSVTPNLHDRVALIDDIFPFEGHNVRHYGHLFAALSGFFLLTLATNLLRRKRIAWLLVVILLIISIALFAVGLTCLNYVVLTGYDSLAVRYVRHPLAYFKTATAAVINLGTYELRRSLRRSRSQNRSIDRDR